MNYLEVVKMVNEVLRQNCDSPIDEMRKMGEALIGIANALDGRTPAEAIAIIEAVRVLKMHDL